MTDRDILENPYRIAELDLGDARDRPVPIGVVDRRPLPDATVAAAPARSMLQPRSDPQRRTPSGPDEGVVRRGGEEIHLTKTEFRLLAELAPSPGRVFSRETLLDRVWGSGYFGDGRLVDVRVRRLRTKVEADPANPRHVVTVRAWATSCRPSRRDLPPPQRTSEGYLTVAVPGVTVPGRTTDEG